MSPTRSGNADSGRAPARPLSAQSLRAGRRSRVVAALPASPLILFGIACLVLPLLALVKSSLELRAGGIGFDNFVAVLSSSVDRQAILGSLQFAAIQALLCAVIGTPLALAMLRLGQRGRRWWLPLMNVATSFGGPGLAFAFLLLIGTSGAITMLWTQLFGGNPFPSLGSMFGLNLLSLYIHLPMYVILSLPSFGMLRPEWWEAAQVSRSSRFRYWRRVGFPVIAPFIAAHTLQIFTWSMGSYALPYVVTDSPQSVPLITVEIGRDLQSAVFGLERAATFAVLLMVLAIGTMWLYRTIQEQGAKIL
ncbi:ABC transporter permease subunit [Cryobacterium sp. Y50]|uniref:ABC transporter permease subunit n=1 Tax=Cryobacterium sp. Y50 TaxID=2048286 RepID=UPI0011B032FB|nr:ABC transporter permease subunit [Cryobacterium sp. Y50]